MSSKRWIATFVAVVAILSLVAACGPTPTPEVVEKVVKETVEVEKVVKETVEVEKVVKETVVVEKVITATPEPAPEEKVLTFAQGPDCTQFDPHNTSAYMDFNVYDNIYETLVRRNSETMELEPLLALSWEAVDDLTWQFKLQKGVEFTNGEPFNAETVKYNVERVLNPDNQLIHRSQFVSIDRVEVVDEYTVNIITKAPDPLIPARLATYGGPQVPPEHTEKVGSEGLTIEPIGTGPYKFVEWVKDDRVVLVANDDYWGGRPSVDRVIFKPIPETAARVGALLAGEVDIVNHVPPDDAPRIEESGEARIESMPSFVCVSYGIDVNTPPLDNKLIRQALSYAIDRDSICEDLWLGYCEPRYGAIGSMDFAYDPEHKGLKYDPDKARELIEQAGYAGETIKVVTTAGNWPKDKELSEAVHGWFQAVGLNAELEVLEVSVFYETARHLRLMEGVMVSYVSSTTFDPDGQWWRMLQEGGYMDFGWRHPDFDKEMLRARSILDSAERERIYHDMVYGLMEEEMPILALVSNHIMTGVGSRVKFFKPRADWKVYLAEIEME
jgi:peptide/nickel transport system substrate-binding protein